MSNQIPLWPGALLTNGERVLNLFTDEGEVWADCDGGRAYRCCDGAWRTSTAKWAPDEVGDECPPTLDLTDDDTFEGARRRLAEHLDAPPEAVAQGCMFHLPRDGDGRQWVLKAGCLKGDWWWCSIINLPSPTTDRAEALAAAWAQVPIEATPAEDQVR